MEYCTLIKRINLIYEQIENAVRSDTRRINTSPTTAINPYVKMSTGCSNNQSLPIPVYDADDDLIKCSCSNNICLSGLAMDVNNCIIYFNPTASGYYTIEIIIEDYALNMSNSPLSSVPLQFIVFVQANTIYCCKLDFCVF